MSCKNITLNNKPQKSELWSKIRDTKSSDEEADLEYAKAVSPAFLEQLPWIPKEVTFLRHGESVNDEAKTILVDPKNTQISDVGIKETEKTIQELKDKSINTIYTSPLLRAQQTAKLIEEGIPGINIITIPEIKTWNLGEIEGTPEKDFDEHYWTTNADEAPVGGESFNDFTSRVTDAIDKIKEVIGDKGAILTHSKTVDVMQGMQESYGKQYDPRLVKAYYGKGIDDRSTKQTWPLKVFDKKAALRTEENGEPSYDDFKQITNPSVRQGDLLNVKTDWKQAAARLYKGFEKALEPKYLGNTLLGYTTKTGQNAFELYQEMKKWQEKHPDFNSVQIRYDTGSHLINLYENKGEFAQLDNEDQKVVNMGLKVVNALQADKAIQLYNKFYKTNKEKFYGELLQLGATKDQINLLKDYNEQNEPKSLDDMVTGIMSELSYTVEINTAKQQGTNIGGRKDAKIEYYDGKWDVLSDRMGLLESFNTEKEAKDYLGLNTETPTQHYSNMIASGYVAGKDGWDYKEKEIATPGIIPSIKGHSQFSTDSGLGWLRVLENKEKGIYAVQENQSDLFQKGRNKENLVTKEVSNSSFTNAPVFSSSQEELQQLEDLREEFGKLEGKGLERYNELKRVIEKGPSTKELQENQFLQLLNKDGNWIPFFIKASIQDAAKQGFKEVWYPTGDTASKVEGHETLEQFKREKEDRIKSLSYSISTSERMIDNGLNGIPEDSVWESINREKKEIKQLQEELKRVETEGFGALKPIYDFYETRVKNILDKTYGKDNVERITDEHGNGWYKLEINPQRDLGKILLQKNSPIGYKAPDPEIDKKMKAALEKVGIQTKFLDTLTDTETGKPISDIAKLDLVNKMVEVALHKADKSTIPEEAAHAYVELLPKDSPLLTKMMDQVTSFKLYAETLAQYKSDKRYRNADGTINYQKIKKEAIGKILAQVIINGEPLKEESESKELVVWSWWKELTKYTDFLFERYGTNNPFEEMAARVINANTSGLNVDDDGRWDPAEVSQEEYAQKPRTLSDSLDKLEQDQKNIHLDDTINDKTGQKRHDYWYTAPDGTKQKAAGSVTSIKVDAALKNRKGMLAKRSEVQKQVDLLAAEFGSQVHEYMENIIKGAIDTNLSLKTPDQWVDTKRPTDPVESAIYNKLQGFAYNLVGSYVAGTKFFVECRIFDPKFSRKVEGQIQKGMGGSIDFLAVEPDGKFDIYDWKSQTINKGLGMADYKKLAYNVQLEEYVRILKDVYGLDKPGKLRDIPIATTYEWEGGKQKRLIDIEIGSFDINDIPEEKAYLRPIAADKEEVKDLALRKFLIQLKGVKDAIVRLQENTSDSAKRHDLLQRKKDLEIAIQDIKLLDSSTKYRDFAQDLIEYVSNNIDNLTATERHENKRNLEAFANTSISFKGSVAQMENLLKDPLLEEPIIQEAKKQLAQFEKISIQAQVLVSRLDDISKKRVDELVEGENLGDFNTKELELKYDQKYVTDMSLLPVKSIQLLHKFKTQAETDLALASEHFYSKLKELRKEFTIFTKSKGINNYEGFRRYFTDGTDEDGNIRKLNKYSDKYWDEYKKAIQEKTATWIQENTTFDDKKYNKTLETFRKAVELRSYGKTTEEEIRKERDKKIADYEKYHNPNLDHFNPDALLNRENHFLTPLEKWKSDKFKEMESTPILRKIYDLFNEIDQYAYETGATRHLGTNFLPVEEMTPAERKVRNIKKEYKPLESWRVPEDVANMQYPMDYRTGSGEEVRELKKPGIRKVEHPSLDLIENYYKFFQEVTRFKIYSDIEGDILDIVEAERAKNSIGSNKYGKIEVSLGKLLGIKNKTNLEILKEFVDGTIYGKNFSEKDKLFSLPWIKDKLSRKAVASSALTWLNTAVLTSPIPAFSNLVGGFGNLLLKGKEGKHFTQKDVGNAIAKLTSMDEKEWKMLRHFDLSTEMHKEIKTDLSEFDKSWRNLNKENFIEMAMFMMRWSDKAVQVVLQSAALRGIMLDEEGNWHHIITYVQKMDKFKDIFNVPSAERVVLEREMIEEVKKLKETRSLHALGTLVDGKFTLPYDIDKKNGIRSTRTDIQETIKQDAKDILGNMSADDNALMKRNFWAKLFTQFRNWLPRLFRARFGRIYYNPDTETLEEGYWSYFFKQFTKENFIPLLNFIGNNMIGAGFSDSVVGAAKFQYEKTKQKAEENGIPFDVTEAEYIHSHAEKLRRFLRDIAFTLSFGALLYLWKQKSLTDDKNQKATDAFVGRALRHFYNEFSYFADPREFQQLLGNSVPLSGLLKNLMGFVASSVEAGYGEIAGDDKLVKSQHLAPKVIKLFPYGGSALELLGMMDDNFNKEWGITPTPTHF